MARLPASLVNVSSFAGSNALNNDLVSTYFLCINFFSIDISPVHNFSNAEYLDVFLASERTF